MDFSAHINDFSNYIRNIVLASSVSSLADHILCASYSYRLQAPRHFKIKSFISFLSPGENRYFAKELFNNDFSRIDLTKADMFSLGASIYELCLGKFLNSSDPTSIRDDGDVGAEPHIPSDSCWTIGEDTGELKGAGDEHSERDVSSEWQRLR